MLKPWQINLPKRLLRFDGLLQKVAQFHLKKVHLKPATIIERL